jgi:CDP-diacylglycerol pyrophosphatase
MALLAAAAALLALASCAQAPGGSGPQAAAPPASCKLARAPDTLLSLARCCAESIAANPSCRAYDADAAYVIVRDNAPDKPDAYLIIPVAPVTGIEDAQIFAPPVRDYWQYGWAAAARFVGVPPAATALAINSTTGRTQNQLHIHISCVRPDVAAALVRARIGTDPARPTTLPLGPDGHRYTALRVRALGGDASPFLRVAAEPGARADMKDQSIAVIGTDSPDVWDVVDTRAGGGNPGAAEELLDQSCGGGAKG